MISEGLYLNLVQKPRFKKTFYLKINIENFTILEAEISLIIIYKYFSKTQVQENIVFGKKYWKCYNTPSRNLISKYLIDVIH